MWNKVLFHFGKNTACPETTLENTHQPGWRWGAVLNSLVKAPIVIILLLGLFRLTQQGLAQSRLSWGWIGFFAVTIPLVAFPLVRWLRSGQTANLLSEQARDQAFAAICAALIAGIIAWTLALNSVQSSDFARYYRHGIVENTTRSPAEWINSCKGRKPFICLRILSLAPYSALVGTSYTAFKLLNACLHLVSVGLLYVIVRRWLGTVAAAAAALVLALHPERLFALTLATTDHTAIPAIIGVMAVLAASSKLPRLWHSLWLGMALGILIFIADMTRTIGAILILAGGLFALLAIRQANAKFTWITVLVGTLSYVVIKAILYRALLSGQSDINLFVYLSALDLNTRQDHWTIVVWRDKFFPSIPRGEQYSVALTKLLAELANNITKFPEYIAAKAGGLLSSGGYKGFGFNPVFEKTSNSFFTVKQSTRLEHPAFLYVPIAFSLIVCSLAITGMFRSLRDDPLTSSALCLLLAFLVITVVLGQAQPRYIALVVPALAVLAANGILVFSEIISNRIQRDLLRTGLFITLSVTVIITLFYSSVPILRSLGETKYPGFQPFALTDPGDTDSFCRSVGTVAEKTFKRMTITFPPDKTGCVRVSKHLDPQVKAISFFVTGSRLRSHSDPTMAKGTSYQILLDNQVVLEVKEPSKGIQFHRIPIEPATTREISISVRANDSDPTQAERGLLFWYWQEQR